MEQKNKLLNDKIAVLEQQVSIAKDFEEMYKRKIELLELKLTEKMAEEKDDTKYDAISYIFEDNKLKITEKNRSTKTIEDALNE